MDGITTGVDSLVHDEYKPAGIVQSCTEVYLMAEGRRDGSKSGQIFDIAFGLVGDGLSGYMSGKCYKAVKENLQTKQASRIRIEDQVKSKCEEVKSYQKTDLVQQKPVKINQKISNQAQKNPKIGSRASHQNGSLQPKIRARIDPLNILPESLDSLNVDGQINIQRVYESMKQFKAEYLDIGSVGEINNQFDLQSAIPNVSDLDGIIRNSSNTHTKIMETHAFKNLIIESDKLLAQAQEKPAQFRVANNSPQLVKESVNEVANFN
ncbi:UNKNOWN [Stylonychia lemnae]|uniref:Uncharacterized protein n=1 Tax=Stylonychia lemnae TaxID=5949 RepID=A0A077ZRT1_STYLE|nr:UNKNOWN [Stylonychia lemnae]|eukprot:CDW72055.1 UNKNOWN [Stylonychia lemnae]